MSESPSPALGKGFRVRAIEEFAHRFFIIFTSILSAPTGYDPDINETSGINGSCLEMPPVGLEKQSNASTKVGWLSSSAKARLEKFLTLSPS
jgi:hypothetical protein